MSRHKPVVGVLMSTYNGEKFIREQLDSIFAQRGVQVRLFVRDDGSTDNTLRIIDEYREKYPVIKLEDNDNLGAGRSFLRLLYQFANEPDVDFFAFADQDDIWLEDKLITGVNSIINSKKTGPVLYTSNQYLYVNGKNTGKRFKDKQSTELIPRLSHIQLYGCTYVFTKELAKLVAGAKRPVYRFLKHRNHDGWLLLAAITCGHVLYDDNPHILYRIHKGNLVGLNKISIIKRLGRIQRLWKKRDDANLRMLTAQELLVAFPKMCDENKKILVLYANYQNSWNEKWRLLTNREVLGGCEENPFIFKLKVLINFV